MCFFNILWLLTMMWLLWTPGHPVPDIMMDMDADRVTIYVKKS